VSERFLTAIPPRRRQESFDDGRKATCRSDIAMIG
jgi:hypothetical protein